LNPSSSPASAADTSTFSNPISFKSPSVMLLLFYVINLIIKCIVVYIVEKII
jgi:hypothetical protein